MIDDDELKAIRERANCVELSMSIEECHRRWREFERHAIADVKALLDENVRLTKGLSLAWSDGFQAALDRPSDGEAAIKFRDLKHFRDVKAIIDGTTVD